ncbi:MAG: replication-relaxation family protein [Chloroflexi bacterium]|nr:replication-relaxation family protein [Chloroflexota bacterium]
MYVSPTSELRQSPYDRPQRLVTRLSPYRRALPSDRPPMRLTDRDRRILEAIHTHDGFLSDDQVQQLFFSGRSQMLLRMRLLFHHGYINRPNLRQRMGTARTIYWLTEQGAAFVAGLSGTPLRDFSWRREPRWAQLDHDIAVNDVRIAVTRAYQSNDQFRLRSWISSGEFWSHPDKVEFRLPDGRLAKRYVRPDGYCVVQQGQYTSRLLWEIDRSTEDNHRWAHEKALPSVAYVLSDVYRLRFGYNAGRWLVVTTGDRRLTNLKATTEQALGKHAAMFMFSTFDRVNAKAILTAPIWLQGNQPGPTALFNLLS